ncbi:MAG: RNA methyltransferase [Clostridia bacterium]|nr:RNA methyltransferase [Clostridia bacterium]MDE7328766.1 RNA methyltransferase [Clostridia bacterium]
MIEITSVKNQRVGFVKKLKDKSFRREQGLIIVEGENLIKDLPSSVCVECLFVEKDKLKDYEYIVTRYGEDKLTIVDDKVMKALSETVTPSGILAVVKFERGEKKIDGNCVVLDGVSDPGNFGTIIRTCVACGVKNILAVGCVDYTSGKVVRSSMGGIFKVNVVECDLSEALNFVKDKQLLALDMGGESIYNASVSNKEFALAVGSESRGISKEIKEAAKIIALPMSGEIESLNAAVSLSVALYKLVFGK